MTVALHGNLQDFGIGEVFQLIGQQRKTGTLELSDEAELRLRIAFDDGAVVSGERVGAYEQAALGDILLRAGMITPQRLLALEREIGTRDARLEDLLRESGELHPEQLDEMVGLITRETLFELLRWTRGSFHFSAGLVVHERSAAQCIPAEQLLMDGLRMLDEWRGFDEGAVDPEAVFQATGRFEDYRRAHPAESPERLAVAERLFLLIDGRQPVQRVVDLSRLGRFEGARLLTRFRRAGLIERLAVELVAKKQRRLPSLEFAKAPSVLGPLLAVLPWLLLGTIVFAVLQQPAARIPPAESLTQQALLRAVDDSFETLRLRNLADAYRYARGSWPAGITDLRRFVNDARKQQPLAPLDSREYYFAQRGDSFVLLAPEPSRGRPNEGR